MASTTRSACSVSPESSPTPVTCGVPLPARMVSSFTAEPRRTSTPGSPSAAFPKTCSKVERRAVYVTNRSSPARGPASARLGGISPSTSRRAAPAETSASKTSGSSSSSTTRPAGCRKWAMRNCVTPSRDHPSHASPTDSGTRSASRSSTVTSCPSRASSMPPASPHTPPPNTTILAICGLPPPRAVTTHAGDVARLRTTEPHTGRKSNSSRFTASGASSPIQCPGPSRRS